MAPFFTKKPPRACSDDYYRFPVRHILVRSPLVFIGGRQLICVHTDSQVHVDCSLARINTSLENPDVCNLMRINPLLFREPVLDG